MKKIYLLLLLCCLSFTNSQATIWFFNVTFGDVNNVANWSTSYPVPSTIHPTDFNSAGDIWIINITGRITSGQNWSVNGTVIMQQAGRINKTGSAPSTVSIGTSLNMSDSSNMTTAVLTGDLYVYLYGQLSVNNKAYFTTGLTAGFSTQNCHIHFCDTTGTPSNSATAKAISWTSIGVSKYTSLTIDRRSVRKLSSNIPVPIKSTNADSLLGTLHAFSFTVGCTDTATFRINDSANIYTQHTGGMDSTIQHMTAISFSSKANYYYNGAVAQVTGVTLPDTIGDFTVTPKCSNVTINNNAGVTLSKATLFSAGSNLNLQKGLLTNTTFLKVDKFGYINIDAGRLSDAPNYTFGAVVTYANLGTNALSYTTGLELQPFTDSTLEMVRIWKPGATITLGSPIHVNGWVMLDSGNLDVSTNNYDITFTPSNIHNSAAFVRHEGGASFLPRGGSVIFNGGSPYYSTLSGSSGWSLYNLTLNNQFGLTIDQNDTVANQLTLSNGLFNIGTDSLVLGPAALPVAGSFSSNSMIVNNTAGEVIKQLSGTPSQYFFPVGDASTYSPIGLDFAGSIFGAGASAGVNLHNIKHPANANITNFLKRYWSVDIQNFASVNYIVTAQYDPSDVVGVESRMAMGRYTNAWSKYQPANTLTHTLTTGTGMNVNSLPNDYTGIDSTKPSALSSRDTIICYPGGTYTLDTSHVTGDPGLSFTWAPASGLSATTGASVVATPSVTTTYTLTVTDGNGFTNTSKTTITVNATPSVGSIVSNGPSFCVGDSLIMIAVSPSNVGTFSWTGPVSLLDSATAMPSRGSLTPAASGMYTLTVTNGPGTNCATSYTYSVTVNALPPATVATGGGTYCVQADIAGTVPVGTGTVYFQGTTRNGVLTSDGSPQTVTASGTYYFRALNGTGCWGPQDSVTVVINPLPNDYSFVPLANSGAFCVGDSGVHVIFNASDTGVKYELDTAGVAVYPAVAGTGSAIDFGLMTKGGWYSVTATNIHTGCIRTMTDSVLVRPISLPVDQTLTGGGGYCAGTAGVPIGLFASDPADSYYLYFNNTLIDSNYDGSGSAITFGAYTAPGIYTVKAKDFTYGCRSNLSGSDSVWITPLPNVYNVLGGGTMCADGTGFEIKLDGSDASVFHTGTGYQLFKNGVPPIGPIGGSGDTLNFGTQLDDGNYTVVATFTDTVHNISCSSDMAGSATIHVNPLPLDFSVSGGGDYCVNDTVAKTISMPMSQIGVAYQLYYNGTPIGGPVYGTGVPFDFGSFTDTGSYTVRATDTTFGCTRMMSGSATITIHYLPQVYTVAGTGAFCAGSTGIDVTLSNSEVGVTYQMLYMGSPLGTPINAITTGVLDFGIQTGMGTYGAYAISPFGCIDTMISAASITVLSLPLLYNVTGGGSACFPGTSHVIGLSGSDTGVSYQLKRNDTAVSTHFGTGASFNFGSYSVPGNYTVVATRVATGCKDTMIGSVDVVIYPLPLVQTVGGGGIFCEGTAGAQITLSGSEVGVDYYLRRDTFSRPVDTVAGSGSAVTFGYQPLGGIYKAFAINSTTGCFNNMTDSARNVRNPLPVVFTIAGGGNYCSGGAGLPIYLDASNPGKNYELLMGTTHISTLPGTGFALNYGLFTNAGTYHIVATDVTTGCSRAMASTVSINVNVAPPVSTVSGGGSYCAGGAGFPVNVSASTPGVRYKLYRNGTIFMDSLDGTGSALHYPNQIPGGVYTVTARDIISLCSTNMTGSATITVNPVPTPFNIKGGGAYCEGGPGVPMWCDNSELNVNYQLQIGGLPIGGPRVGDGDSVGFGMQTLAGWYRIFAINTVTGCTDTMNGNKQVIINPLPVAYTVTGGGVYCVADSGLHVGLSASDTDVNYQLYGPSGAIGSPRLGIDGTLDLGLQTAAGNYIVVGTNRNTSCVDTMSDSAHIAIQPYLTPTVTLTPHPSNTVYVGQLDTIVATVTGGGTNPTFKWYINRNEIPGQTDDTLTFPVYFDRDTIVCEVTSVGLCAGITTTKTVIINLEVNAVKQINSSFSDFKLVPNPNKGAFTLRGVVGNAGSEDVIVEVTNMLGEIVYKDKIQSQNGIVDQHINLGGNLANGMYLLNIRSGSSSNVFHFVIEQ